MSYFEKIRVYEYPHLEENAPVELVESSIIKDTVDDVFLLKNIFLCTNNEPVIAILVSIICRDIYGEIIPFENKEETLEYSYQDIHLTNGDFFGRKIGIHLPYNTRDVTVTLLKAATDKGDVWKSNPEKLITLKEPEAIDCPVETLKAFNDRHDTFGTCYYHATKAYWRCCCGFVNFPSQSKCLECNIDRSKAKELFKKENFETVLAKDIDEQKRKQEEIEQKKKEEEQKQLEETLKQKTENEKQDQNEIEQKSPDNEKSKTRDNKLLMIWAILLLLLFGIIVGVFSSKSKSSNINDNEVISETETTTVKSLSDITSENLQPYIDDIGTDLYSHPQEFIDSFLANGQSNISIMNHEGQLSFQMNGFDDSSIVDCFKWESSIANSSYRAFKSAMENYFGDISIPFTLSVDDKEPQVFDFWIDYDNNAIVFSTSQDNHPLLYYLKSSSISSKVEEGEARKEILNDLWKLRLLPYLEKCYEVNNDSPILPPTDMSNDSPEGDEATYQVAMDLLLKGKNDLAIENLESLPADFKNVSQIRDSFYKVKESLAFWGGFWTSTIGYTLTFDKEYIPSESVFKMKVLRSGAYSDGSREIQVFYVNAAEAATDTIHTALYKYWLDDYKVQRIKEDPVYGDVQWYRK